MFAGVRAPDSMLIIIISTLSTLVHVSWATDVCVTVFTRSCAATAIGMLVGRVHWLCHLDLVLVVVEVHWLCHLDSGLIVDKIHWLCPLDSGFLPSSLRVLGFIDSSMTFS